VIAPRNGNIVGVDTIMGLLNRFKYRLHLNDPSSLMNGR